MSKQQQPELTFHTNTSTILDNIMIQLFNLPGYLLSALFEDNFHLSFSPMLVQPQYPSSKEHSSSIAADNEKD